MRGHETGLIGCPMTRLRELMGTCIGDVLRTDEEQEGRREERREWGGEGREEEEGAGLK